MNSLRAITLLNDAGRVAEIMWMIECGWIKQILISHELGASLPPSSVGRHGYHYILAEIVPLMRLRGVSEEAID